MKPSARIFLWLVRFIVVVILLCLAVLAVTVYLSKRDLDNYRAELEARGETFDITKLSPPFVPEDQNGGPAAVAAASQIAAIEKSSEPKRLLFVSEVFDGAQEVLHFRESAALLGEENLPWSEVAIQLDPMQPHLSELRRSARFPVVAYNLDYSKDLFNYFDYWHHFVSSQLKASQFLTTDTLLRLHQGDIAMAVDDIETQLLLTKITATQPFKGCQTVYSHFVSNAQKCTWELLQSDKVDAAQLERLQRSWEDIRSADLVQFFRMERAWATVAFSQPLEGLAVNTGGPPPPSAGGPKANTPRRAFHWLWRNVYRYSEERRLTEGYQTLIDECKTKGTHSLASCLYLSLKARDSLKTGGTFPIHQIASWSYNWQLGKTLTLLINSEVQKNMTITAIALRRYQLDHAGQFPAELHLLVPNYLKALPRDPMDGETLRYNPASDGFTLYSIGLNWKDDGGDSRMSSLYEPMDIVWPRAAKPAPTTP